MTATVRVAVLRGIDRILTELGGNAERLCADCGFDLRLLDDPNALMPYEVLVELLEYCSEQLQCPDLGLKVAIKQDIDVLGPLALAMQNSDTMAEAMHCAAAYMYVLTPAMQLNITPLGSETKVGLAIRLPGLQAHQARQTYDKTAALTHRVMSLLAKDAYQPISVALPHEPLCKPEVYREYFGVPVHFNADRVELLVPTECMEINLESSNAHIKQIALDFLRSEKPAANASISERVEQVILSTLGTESCNRDDIAAVLSMHPRTLQRHLDAEGVSFNELRDQVRRGRADYYVRETRIPLCQVAAMIGYSDQTILTRSCRRWFGATPRQLRINSAAG